MKIVKSKDFKAEQAWSALNIANINCVSTRVHWTDKPYKWHVNDGDEVFAVLGGAVEIRYRENGVEKESGLKPETFSLPKSAANTSHLESEKREFW